MFNNVLPKYFIKTLLSYLLLALAIFTSVLFMNQFVRVFNTAILLGASFGWIIYALFELMPAVLALSIPMAYQLSMLLSLAALSSQGEILALRATGFSARQIVWPFGMCAVFLCMILFLISNWISPIGFKKFQDSRHIMAKSMTELKLQPKTFIDLGNWRMIAQNIDSKSGKMDIINLFMHSSDNPKLVLFNVNAPKGRYTLHHGQGLELVLENGNFQKTDPDNLEEIIKADYKKYKVFIPLYKDVDFKNRHLSLNELTTPEILKEVKEGKLPAKRNAEYKIEASMRFALALSPIIFFLVSAPLGLLTSKHSKAWAMILSIVILFAYYGSLMSGINIAKKFFFLSWYSPWLGNILGLIAAVFLWRKKFK